MLLFLILHHQIQCSRIDSGIIVNSEKQLIRLLHTFWFFCTRRALDGHAAVHSKRERERDGGPAERTVCRRRGRRHSEELQAKGRL